MSGRRAKVDVVRRLVRRWSLGWALTHHQVLLLSTHEEIAGHYYDDLSPSVDRAYRLRFGEAKARTIVEDAWSDLPIEHIRLSKQAASR